MKWKWKLAQAAEIRWWKYYLANKPPQKYLSDKSAYWYRIMKLAEIEIPPRARVLDAGCGPAGIFMVLDRQEVDALDPLLHHYAKNLPHFDPIQYPWVQFISESLEEYETDHPYQTIFCLNAINHVADIQLALDRLLACMEPQTVLWLSIDAHRYSGLRWIFQRLPGDILHPHQFTLEEYQDMLLQRGLTIEKTIPLKPGRIFNYYLIKASFGKEKTR